MPRMSLLNKLFGAGKAAKAAGPESSHFHESEPTTERGSKNAPRRELVQVVLRDTMRNHGIPSDWIDCRILSVVSRSALSGMHVHFIVRHGQSRLLTYAPAFQSSFQAAIEKFDPRAAEWLFSLSWQFKAAGDVAAMPDPASWVAGHSPSAASVAAASATPASEEEDDVQQDLKALFAIRDAAFKEELPAKDRVDFQPTQPGS
jgi:hypothetical protein